MRVLYIPLSQYTINQLLEKGDNEYHTRLPAVFAHLDRFPNETVDSLNDLFTEEVITSFFTLITDVDMLHRTRCKTIDDKEGNFLVISEVLYGNDYTDYVINDVTYSVKFCVEQPAGILMQIDYYKTRDVAYDYQELLPKQDIIFALKEQQEVLTKRVMELLQESRENLFVQQELDEIKKQLKTAAMIESIYGSFNVEDLLIKMDVICQSIFSAADSPTAQELATTIGQPTTTAQSTQEQIDKKDEELQALLDKHSATLEDEEVLVSPSIPDEEEEDEDWSDEDEALAGLAQSDLIEEEEEEVRLVDVLDDMTRKELKMYISDNDLDIRVKKSMEDDDIRDRILEATEPDEEEPEDDEDDEDADLVVTDEDHDDEELFDELEELEESLASDSSFPATDEDTTDSLEDVTASEAKPSSILATGIEYKAQVVDFIELMQNTNPGMRYPSNKKAVRKACATLYAIANIDEMDMQEVFEALTWGIQNEFWKNQIISLAALRKESQNGLMKYQNIMNGYLKELDKQTKPEEAASSAFEKLED